MILRHCGYAGASAHLVFAWAFELPSQIGREISANEN